MKNSVAVICAVALPALLILGSVGVYFGSDNPSFDIATRTEQQTAGVADTGNGVVSGRNAGSNSEATGATSNAQGSARPHGQGSVKSVAADDEGSAKVTLDSGESPDEPKPDPDLTEAQNYVVFQLSKTPSAVFKDLRSNYDRQPGEWTTKGKGNLDAIDTLLAFAPKDTKWQTWEVERFLSFVCYLADRGEVKASGFLWTVNAQFEGNEPQPLMEILKARSGSFESCFAENKVVGIVTMAPFSIKLEVGGRD